MVEEVEVLLSGLGFRYFSTQTIAFFPDICEKTDILTEKYMNKNMCSVFMDELCNICILYSIFQT